MLKKLWEAITYPFISISVLIDEERRQNVDGRYDKYWERKNAREARKNGKV